MMSIAERSAPAGCGFVEVLTHGDTGAVFGYRVTGASAGPQVVVAGICTVADEVFERFLSLPTLPWMRGTLTLLRLDRLDDLSDDLSPLEPLGPVDRTVVLPLAAIGDHRFALRRSYQTVLNICAELGMIQGRGVRRRVSPGP